MVKVCPGCGTELVDFTLSLHPKLARDLEWLVELRKASGSEKDLDEVIGRLITLEVTKRRNIEARKKK